MTGYTLIAIILALITLDNMWANWCRSKWTPEQWDAYNKGKSKEEDEE